MEMEMEKKGEQQNQNQKKALRGPVQFWYMGSHMATFWCCAAAAGVRSSEFGPAGPPRRTSLYKQIQKF